VKDALFRGLAPESPPTASAVKTVGKKRPAGADAKKASRTARRDPAAARSEQE
jgi:hypothetical protein